MTDRERARQYLKDYPAGQIYCSARMTIDKDQIIAFAGQFDPQLYHLDEEAAHKSVSAGLAASGWHTAAPTMRLLVDSQFRPAHGILGVGVDELHWLRTRPSDSLYVETEVLEVRPSKSEADRGLIRARTTTFNQSGEQVQMYVGNLLVSRRPAVG